MTTEIKLIPTDNLISIIPFIKQLNPTLPETTFKTRLEEMIAQGYQCAGLYIDNQLIGICGLWIMTKLYVGKHIEPDNVFCYVANATVCVNRVLAPEGEFLSSAQPTLA